ncbi:MAG: DUF615 domain-containing protein [Betaproteobacteria bacterium]|nr:DUF615 domain-containing protein [Betaproteobacteria bacterium]
MRPSHKDHESPDDLPLSKTRRKALMHELQELGEALVALSTEALARVDLPESLRAAVQEAQGMRAFEARRRQLQYIGKLMRDADPEPIRAALAVARGVSASETARLHRLERLREGLLESEEILGEIAAAFPGADLQHLRQLRRNALKEAERGSPPKSYRAIFQMLKRCSE